MKKLFLKLKDQYEKVSFIQKVNIKGKSVIHYTTYIRGKNFIFCKGNLSLGEGSKLLCWNRYTSGKKLQYLTPKIEIGKNFRATRNLTIQCANHIVIGDNVLVSSNVFIIDYNHDLLPISENYLDGPLNVGEVYIGDGAWIGNNVVILPNVHIGKKVIIGAGSVVTKDIEDYSIAVGNPCKIIKKWDFDKMEWISVVK